MRSFCPHIQNHMSDNERDHTPCSTSSSSSVFGHDQSDPQSVVLDKVGTSLPQVIRCSPELGLQGNGLRPEVLPT
jgi:hypothetical protein